jgi:hypothetical protein
MLNSTTRLTGMILGRQSLIWLYEGSECRKQWSTRRQTMGG